MAHYDLQLQKGGKLVTLEWSEEDDDFVEIELEPMEYLFFANNTICLDSISLRDVFLLMEKDIEFFSILTYCPFLDDLINEGLSQKTDANNISLLELRRKSSLQKDGDKNYIHKRMDFYGKGHDETFALDMMQTNNIAHLPLFINEDVNVMDELEENTVFSFSEKFTLSEFVYGLVYELTTFGHPEERNFQKNILFDRLDEENLSELSGMPLSEFKEILEEKINQKITSGKIPCVICGNDSRSQHFNKPKDMCFTCFLKSQEN
jgi:hypothetical protein